MQLVSVWESDDGQLFRNIEDCFKHETNVLGIKWIMDGLNPRPILPSQPTQQNKDDVVYLLKTFIDTLDVWVDDEEKEYSNDFFEIRDKIIGRRISNEFYDNPYVIDCWNRFNCIDKDYNEWLNLKCSWR